MPIYLTQTVVYQLVDHLVDAPNVKAAIHMVTSTPPQAVVVNVGPNRVRGRVTAREAHGLTPEIVTQVKAAAKVKE